MYNYNLWIVTLLPCDEAISFLLLKEGYRIKKLACDDKISINSDETISSLFAVSIESRWSDLDKFRKYLVDILGIANIKYFAIILTRENEDASWSGSNIRYQINDKVITGSPYRSVGN